MMSDLARSLAGDFQHYLDRTGQGVRRGASALAGYLEQGARAALPGLYGEQTLADRLAESQKGLAEAFSQGDKTGFDYMLHNHQYQRSMADFGGAFVGSMANVGKSEQLARMLKLVHPDDALPAHDIMPPHEVRNADKLNEIANAMAAKGEWDGRPVLAYGGQGLTGSHRIAAAQQAGVDVPVVRVDQAKVDKWFERNPDKYYFDPLRSGSDWEVADWLKEVGDRRATRLMRIEAMLQDEQ